MKNIRFEYEEREYRDRCTKFGVSIVKEMYVTMYRNEKKIVSTLIPMNKYKISWYVKELENDLMKRF